MLNRELRMRCIEALSSMGVRETQRLTRDAQQLEAWVNEAEPDYEPEAVEPVAEDKGDEPPVPQAATKPAGKARRPR